MTNTLTSVDSINSCSIETRINHNGTIPWVYTYSEEFAPFYDLIVTSNPLYRLCDEKFGTNYILPMQKKDNE